MPTTSKKEKGKKSLPVKWRDNAWPARVVIRSASRGDLSGGLWAGVLAKPHLLQGRRVAFSGNGAGRSQLSAGCPIKSIHSIPLRLSRNFSASRPHYTL